MILQIQLRYFFLFKKMCILVYFNSLKMTPYTYNSRISQRVGHTKNVRESLKMMQLKSSLLLTVSNLCMKKRVCLKK